MPIRFQFDLEKAVLAMAFVVHRLGSVQKVRLMKLLYIADRDHFLRYGWSITGDHFVAMKWGPVPSDCLHALDGELSTEAEEEVCKHIQLVNFEVFLKSMPDFSRLSETETEVLDAVVEEHGRKPRRQLELETHEYPEYKIHYVKGTSTPIPYESILKCYAYADETRFRHNRPVISEAMASKMLSPFPDPEPDL